MSAQYRAVQWNAHKRRYDAWLIAGVGAYLAAFVLVGSLAWTGERAISAPVLVMRALGTASLALLHIILCIGPLARLTPLAAPLLYNRRHLGVTMFLLALAHAALATLYYGAFGGVNPLAAVLSAGSFRSVSGFPFEALGLAALVVLFLMAATSHDFWLANLSPRVWKWLHMLVYPSYALLVLHVSLGVLQSERHPTLVALLLAGVGVVASLHSVAGLRQLAVDRRRDRPDPEGWIDAAPVNDIPDGRARVVCPARGEKIAVFREGDAYSAVANACAHQGGPLGEGKIVNGCITCPWHGYQYLPGNGQSPPPYTEKIPTYQVRVRGGMVQVRPDPLPPGTPVTPARAEDHHA
jgi:nitrite reductase/ring-hydroxylating ferredoxin subunit/DMSO/TMAO reductase YedYZ heme-binding membrane subunit